MSDAGTPDLPASGRSADRAQVRARLLEAAEQVFGRRGFYNASIAEITRRAGIAQGSFYLHFPSKEQVFRELMRTRGEELRATLVDVGGEASGWELHRMAFRAYFEWIGRHPWFYRVTRQAEFVDPELREGWYREFAEGYAAMLRDAMRDGVIPEADPEVLAWAMMGAADFTAMRWVVWQEEERPMPAEVIESFTALAARLLGVEATTEDDFPRARTRL